MRWGFTLQIPRVKSTSRNRLGGVNKMKVACEYIPSYLNTKIGFLTGVFLANQKLTSLIQYSLTNEIKKTKNKKRINNNYENAYTLSRKRFLPTEVFNSANVSSSFIEGK